MNFLNQPLRADYPYQDPYEQDSLPTAARAQPNPVLEEWGQSARRAPRQVDMSNVEPLNVTVTRGSAAQEAAARQAGFPSYDAQQAYLRRKQIRSGGSEGRGSQGGGAAPASPHPKSVFDYIAERLRSATSR
jgi:hypothetical protein